MDQAREVDLLLCAQEAHLHEVQEPRAAVQVDVVWERKERGGGGGGAIGNGAIGNGAIGNGAIGVGVGGSGSSVTRCCVSS
jgi:hypothetical protein